jgi:hypothetical protein
MRVLQARKSALIPSMPVAKIGFALPTPSPSFGGLYCESDFDLSARNVESPAPRVPKPDLKHSFVIRAMKRRGLFKPRLRVYACIRCRYTFLVNERRGVIVAVDRKVQPISNPANSSRIATFQHGPCPALKSATHKIRVGVERPRPQSGLLAFIARIGAKTRYPYFVESNLHPPDGITPQDLLS